jgi:hypothetical protein
MDLIDRRKELRTRFVNELYETVDGSAFDPVGVGYVAGRVGLDISKPEDEREALGITQYLEGEGLIRMLAVGGVVALTHRGAREVEDARRRPDQPTDHFAPINIVYAQTITHSAIQQGSPQATQSLTIVNQGDLQQLEDLVQSLRGSIDSLGLDEDQQAELEADIQTLEAQLASPKPKKEVISPGLQSVRRILEGAASQATASGLLEAIQTLSNSL